jgi:hypothetical protein
VKFIALAWRDPSHNLKMEKFDASEFSVKTDPGWLKIIGTNGPVRLLPSDKVAIVEFGEEEKPSRIASPHAVGPLIPKVS